MPHRRRVPSPQVPRTTTPPRTTTGRAAVVPRCPLGPRPLPRNPPLENDPSRPVPPFNPPGEDFGPTDPGRFQRQWKDYGDEKNGLGKLKEIDDYNRGMRALQPQDPNAQQSGTQSD